MTELHARLVATCMFAGLPTPRRCRLIGNWTIKELKHWSKLELGILNSELCNAIADKSTKASSKSVYRNVVGRIVSVKLRRIDEDAAANRKGGKKQGGRVRKGDSKQTKASVPKRKKD